MTSQAPTKDIAPPTLAVIRARYDAEAPAAVRRELGKILDGHPRRDDALLVGTELATNTVLHARGRRRLFKVEVEVTEASVCIAVVDDGPPKVRRPRAGFTEALGPDGQRESGRGLYIVEALAQRCGDDGDGRRWAELARWMYYARNGLTDRTLTPMQAHEFWQETPAGLRAGDPDADFEIWNVGEFGQRLVTTTFTRIPLELP